MNRVLKKAISFVSAVVMSVSAMTAAAVSAQAASELSIKQTISNKYEVVLKSSQSALFISDLDETDFKFSVPADASMVMINNEGKKVKIKNTTGYDKVYTIGTMYMPYAVTGGANGGGRGIVLLEKDSKFKALLQNGSFLGKGKLYDRVSCASDGITAVSGKTTYYYGFDGKLIGKLKISTPIFVDGYDKSSKTYVAHEVVDDFDTPVDYYLIKGNKKIKTFKDCNPYCCGMRVIDGKSYLYIGGYDDEWNYSEEYYTMKGKKAPNVTYEQVYTPWETPEYPVTITNDWDNGKLILTNTATGKKIKSYNTNRSMLYLSCAGITPLENGKYFFISCNKDCTKFGCITF